MPDEQTLRLRPPVWALILAVLIGGGFYLGGKWIEVKDHTPTTITVSGEGKTFSAPDIAELTFGVTTGPQRTAKQAMTMIKTSMDKVFKAVKDAGIAEKDISTEQFSLSPQYDWNEGQQTLRGYEASETLRVKVRDLDKVSDVLTVATDAGANQAGDVNFTIDDPEKVRAEARQKAIDQAKAKAVKLAKELGMSLGDIKGFSEGGGYSPPVYMRNSMKMDAASGAAEAIAVPLPAGEQEVDVQVSITYELN
ncbi:MAG: SIMPL domain-containing protein [Candidatus Peribacteraceae bacterium]|jgi:hypothetical protein